LLESFELELLDHRSELVLVDWLFDALLLVFPAYTPLEQTIKARDAPSAMYTIRLPAIFMCLLRTDAKLSTISARRCFPVDAGFFRALLQSFGAEEFCNPNSG
jgi:hypothetical protein